MGYDFTQILAEFDVEADTSSYGSGHINDTFIVEKNPTYILQRINTDVFKNPDYVMENILNVTNHIRKKVREEGGDPKREALKLFKTTDGKPYYKCEDGACFRLYNFIEGTVSYDIVDDPKKLYSAGVAFGKFQRRLSDFPMEILHETIKDFHNTPVRFEALLTAINENKAGRLKNVSEEVKFAMDRKDFCDKIVKEIKKGKVPVRVTHNDTKLNNVMLDKDTDEGVCVIDLDTVMPGSLLYDYGDALRFGGNTAKEDEPDVSKVEFDVEMFKAFTEGFLSQLSDTLTSREKDLLIFSIKLMTFECGIRFLTDYLNGDTYFKTHYENHNLVRARTQFKLISDIESKEKILEKELKNILKNI